MCDGIDYEGQIRDLCIELSSANATLRKVRADHDDLLGRFGSVCGKLDQAQHDMAQERDQLLKRIDVMTRTEKHASATNKRLQKELDQTAQRLNMANRNYERLVKERDAGKMIARPIGDGSGAYLIEPGPGDRPGPGPSTTACDDQHMPDPQQPPRRGSIGPGFVWKFSENEWRAAVKHDWGIGAIICHASTEAGAFELRDRVLEALCSSN